MSLFHFKHFSISQTRSALKVGTDAMLLGALIDSSDCEKGLDIGSGTGVLTLMAAQKNPLIQIDAIELDEGAFLDSKDNFTASQWKDRLKAIHADFLKYNEDKKYDLIFSNPPFYKDCLPSPDKRITQSKHATELSLEILISKSAELMTENGKFWMIFPHDLNDTIRSYAERSNLHIQKKISILGKPERPNRIVFCLGFEQLRTEEFTILIRTELGAYSDQYYELTKDFHGKEIR